VSELPAKNSGFWLRVLVLEENAQVRALLRKLLRKVGITSVDFDNTAAALEAVSAVKPDCILADFVPGVALAREVRRSPNPNLRATPIILLTPATLMPSIESARDHGVNAVLVTPVTAANLRSRIEKVVYNPRAFVSSKGYTGPCRRRVRGALYDGPERRQTDAAAPVSPAEPQAASS
jgi:CheY-like chemotaxis protein